MKRNIIIVVIIISVFLLTGCSNKRTLNDSKFIDITKNYKLKSKDVSKEFEKIKSIKNVTIAESDDLWQMEFYTFDGRDSAKKMYKSSHSSYKDAKSSSIYADESSSRKYDEYTLVTEENYLHVCRVNNTLLYVSVPIDYKVDAEKVIRALKY